MIKHLLLCVIALSLCSCYVHTYDPTYLHYVSAPSRVYVEPPIYSAAVYTHPAHTYYLLPRARHYHYKNHKPHRRQHYHNIK